MMKSAVLNLKWKATAIANLLAIIDYVSNFNPDAVQSLKDEIEGKTSHLPEHPKMYRAARVNGTREMVVRPNFIVIYAEDAIAIPILPVLHASQQWPKTETP